MKIKKEYIIIFIIFLISFGFNLFFSLQIPHYSSDDAYFNLRHSEHVSENFRPLTYDAQSYGGNEIINTHLWHYFLGIMNLSLGSLFAFKIIPSFLASLVVVFGFLIAKQITKNEMAGYIGAVIFAFIPNFINLTLNQISLNAAFVPLMMLFIYSLLDMKKRKGLFLISSFFIVLLEPMNLLFFLALIIFVILMSVEDIGIQRETKEGVVFYLLLLILLNLILYKNIYLDQGLLAVWQNIPNQLYGDYFRTIDIFSLIANIGIVPLTLGIAGFVIGFLREKKRDLYLLSSIIISAGILLLLKLIPFDLGMMLLAVMLSITSVISIDKFISYIKITKAVKYTTLIVGVLILITLFSLVIPSYVYARDTINEGVSYNEVEALEWIRDNTPIDSVVLGNVYEGNLIGELAERTNVIDTQFLLAEDRYYSVAQVYQTESTVKAKRVIDEYGVDYIYFSEKTKTIYDVERLAYVGYEGCFEVVFENEEAVIYEVVC